MSSAKRKVVRTDEQTGQKHQKQEQCAAGQKLYVVRTVPVEPIKLSTDWVSERVAEALNYVLSQGSMPT